MDYLCNTCMYSEYNRDTGLEPLVCPSCGDNMHEREIVERHRPLEKDAKGRWWFWDETSTYRHGPFPDMDEAMKALDGYADNL